MRPPVHAVIVWLAVSSVAFADPVKGPLMTLNGHTGEVQNVVFSPDGKRLASAANNGLKVWDLATGIEFLNIATPGGNVYGLAWSPDGKTLAVGTSKAIRLIDVETGKDREGGPIQCAPHWLFRLTFSPDGKRIAAAGGLNDINKPGDVHVWEVATSKEVLTLVGHTEAVINVAYSADGKYLVSGSGATSGVRAGEVRVWEAETGKAVHVLRGHTNNIYGVALSPDGRRIASCSGNRTPTGGGELKLWETATGKEVLALQGHTATVYSVAFSPDGRRLASCSADKTLRIWDVLSGTVLINVEAHTSGIFSLAFSSDGKRIATASQDRSVKVWDVIPPAAPAVNLPPERLEATWAELAGDDASKAWRAVWMLANVPNQSLPLLNKHLQPAPALTPELQEAATKWIRDLDHRRFPVREQAAKELLKLDEGVLPLLKKAMGAEASLDVRKRVADMVESLTSMPRDPAKVQAVRAVEVLEQIGSTEARKVLEKLAGGLPGARLTEEARSALARLPRQ